MLNLPDEDRYLKTREELIDQMTVLLGGRVAEQIVFGAVTTGAANDLQRVAEISRRDGPRVRDGHSSVGSAAASIADGGAALGPDAPDPRRGAAGARRRGPPRRDAT